MQRVKIKPRNTLVPRGQLAAHLNTPKPPVLELATRNLFKEEAQLHLSTRIVSKQRPIPDSYRFLLEESISPPYPEGWTMRIYDRGTPGELFVQYPDCSQIQSIAWHRERLKAAGIDTFPLERPLPRPAAPAAAAPAVEAPTPKETAPAPVQRVLVRPRPAMTPEKSVAMRDAERRGTSPQATMPKLPVRVPLKKR